MCAGQKSIFGILSQAQLTWCRGEGLSFGTGTWLDCLASEPMGSPVSVFLLLLGLQCKLPDLVYVGSGAPTQVFMPGWLSSVPYSRF